MLASAKLLSCFSLILLNFLAITVSENSKIFHFIKMKDQSITHNIFRIQSIMFGFYCQKNSKKGETGNCLLEEIKYNPLKSEKHKKCVGIWIDLIIFLFCFCCQWMCFNFSVCLIIWYSCRYYEFWRGNKSLYINCKN